MAGGGSFRLATKGGCYHLGVSSIWDWTFNDWSGSYRLGWISCDCRWVFNDWVRVLGIWSGGLGTGAVVVLID